MATEQQEHLRIEQLKRQSADEIEHIAGRDREDLQGWVPAMATEEEIREALEKAFDYRGDVTITKKDGSKVEGYVFDRRSAPSLAASQVRLLVPGSTEKISVPYSEVAGLAFSGRDTAAGKSFEAWVRKYWEKKAAGETGIGLEPERLD